MPPKITQVSWSASNLPLGISFDKSTGKFSGTPDEAGEYDVPVKVETNYGSDEKYVHISVAEKVHWEKISLGNVVLEGYQPILYAPRNGYLIVPGETQYYKRTTIPDKDRPDLGWSACGHTNHDMIQHHLYPTYGCRDWETRNSSYYIYFTGYNLGDNIITRNVVSSKETYHVYTPQSPYSSSDWRAACWSPSYGRIIYISVEGYVVIFEYNNGFKIKSYSQIPFSSGQYANKNCAAWSVARNKFCVSAMGSKVATSSDGDTWEIGSAPDNLLELEFRLDLGKFFARGEYSNLFYVSDDGLNWTQYNNTPIPLNTVKSVAFSSAYGYCAIGIGNDGTQQYSAHSRDLENWTFKKIDSDSGVDLTNVVYAGGGINSFVAAPASGGNYLYVLKGSQAL